MIRRAVAYALVVSCLLIGSYAHAADQRVYVILWFDTEDYLLPASDDAAKHLAEFLTREGIRATFKVVGEKARTLERRGRQDVIGAIKKHELGYHSNWHSVQPSPAMYLSTLGWDEGVAEFDRRERPGLEDVQRIFGQKPSCYGQPGSSWGPQVCGAMRKWDMPVYLDAGSHVRLDDKPHYYGGVLTMYRLAYHLRTGLNGDTDRKEAEDKFLAARQKLLAEGGGLISIYYHPCEFVHKEFWDGVNFRNGANPPREEWKLPPQKSPDESRVAYNTFFEYIRFAKRFENVQFITALEAAKLYRDEARNRRFTRAEIREVAAAVTPDVTFQRRDKVTLAPSEVLLLLNQFVLHEVEKKRGMDVILTGTPFGPSNPVRTLTEPVTTDASQFTRTVADVADYLKRHDRVPTTIWLGSVPVPPEAYLVALAGVALDLLEGKAVPEKITLPPARLAAASYVADDGPNLWGWVIFPRGFRAPGMMELAKRQAWTLKPAVLHRD